MTEAEDTQLGAMRQAVRYRDGLIIGFLALVPLRASNAYSMKIGHHLLVQPSSGRLSIPRHELKKRKGDFEAVLPEALVERITQYLKVYRPLLARAETDRQALWITSRGTAMAYATLQDRIENILRQRRSVKFTSHMFRHAAATFIADVAPYQGSIAAGVLGHTQLDTTKRYYIRGKQMSAMRLYQSEIASIIERQENSDACSQH